MYNYFKRNQRLKGFKIDGTTPKNGETVVVVNDEDSKLFNFKIRQKVALGIIEGTPSLEGVINEGYFYLIPSSTLILKTDSETYPEETHVETISDEAQGKIDDYDKYKNVKRIGFGVGSLVLILLVIKLATKKKVT